MGTGESPYMRLDLYARVRGVCTRTLKRWAESGLFPAAVRMGKYCWVDRAAADRAFACRLHVAECRGTVPVRLRDVRGKFTGVHNGSSNPV